MKLPPKHGPALPQRDPLDAALHDLMNALAAARSYGEVTHLKAKNGSAVPMGTVEDLLEELDRAKEIVARIRRETFRPGDVLECRSCGHEFVYRKSSGRKAKCRRCDSENVEKALS